MGMILLAISLTQWSDWERGDGWAQKIIIFTAVYFIAAPVVWTWRFVNWRRSKN